MTFLTLFFTNEVLFSIVFAFLCLYLWFKYKFSYWKKKGVSGPSPTFPFGNIRHVIQRKAQFFQPYIDNYDKYKHLPYVGMYTFHRPVLSINDPEIAKLILIKDFDHFQAHGIFSGGQGDPLAGHLFNIHGEQWKTLRSKMSPTFTSGKVKIMYPLVEHIANEALNYVDLLYSNGETINFTDLYAKYSMEIIGSVGFGVECNGFKNPNSEFYLRGHEYFEPQSLYWTFVRALAFYMPTFFKALKIRRISPRIINFFYSLVKESVEYRQKHAYKRNDFLQALVELRNEEIVKESDLKSFSLSMNDIVANTMLYMFAGYETSATAGQFAAYELARNPTVQARAREEIRRVLDKHYGECTYDAQNEMVYLNMVIDETMRMHPPMRALFRRCTKKYKMPNSDLTIDEGTLLFVPNQAIQMNPDIFPDPEKFNPDRFSPANKAKMHPCHWMPFGEGPRKCLGPDPTIHIQIEFPANRIKRCDKSFIFHNATIWNSLPASVFPETYNLAVFKLGVNIVTFLGLRQGYIQSKMALIKILHKYELVLDERTPIPMKLKASSLAYAAEGGIWLKLREI